MELGMNFFITNILLGVGLAMDAFSVSLANGLHEPRMKPRKAVGIALIFAVFQALMPMIGWVCIHTIVQYFRAFETLIPWIALALLAWIGGKMVKEGMCECKEGQTCPIPEVTLSALLVQGVATSIDALSVGFTIADYNAIQALVACLVIGVLTFGICAVGVVIGKKFGTKLERKASVFGGAILILIGIKILLEGIGVL